MAKDKIYQIFISSTYKDLKEERDVAIRTVTEIGHLPIGMEQFPATDIEAFDYIKRLIDSSDYYVLILGGKYGSEHPKLKKGFTELEFEYAISKGVPVVVLLKSDIKDIEYLETEKKKKQKLQKFIENASNGRLRREFTNCENLKSELMKSLNATFDLFERPGWVRVDRQDEILKSEQDFFDFELTEPIHPIPSVNPFVATTIELAALPNYISWKDIILTVAPVIIKPMSFSAIEDALKVKIDCISAQDIENIQLKLVSYGFANVSSVSNNEYGPSTSWTLTDKGWKAWAICKGITGSATYRVRDAKYVKQLLSNFSTNLMDEYLLKCPDYIDTRLYQSMLIWSEIIGASSFFLFDKELYEKLIPLYNLCLEMTSHHECYRPTANIHVQRFESYHEMGSQYKEKEAIREDLISKKKELAKLYYSFIEYIKSVYPQYDLAELSWTFEREWDT